MEYIFKGIVSAIFVPTLGHRLEAGGTDTAIPRQAIEELRGNWQMHVAENSKQAGEEMAQSFGKQGCCGGRGGCHDVRQWGDAGGGWSIESAGARDGGAHGALPCGSGGTPSRL
jgi:hypothetical protein